MRAAYGIPNCVETPDAYSTESGGRVETFGSPAGILQLSPSVHVRYVEKSTLRTMYATPTRCEELS